MLGGLVFIRTRDLEKLAKFYTELIGMQPWLEQPNIIILHHGNMILGFHQIQNLDKQEPDLQGMYTFVYPSRKQVDDMHTKLQNVADGKPRNNETYRIYQFFAKDPEGRDLEFQAFLHPLKEVSSAVPR
jgi:catechol-2,3-dioxygenase